MRRIIVAARCNKCDCAGVLRAIRIGMNSLVQLGRGAERERPKKSGRDESGNESTGMRFHAAFHLRVIFYPPGVLRKKFRHDRHLRFEL